MIKAVQATVRHINSTDEAPCHILCLTGKDSWCSYQAAQARGEEYHHTKLVVALLKPIYARLGSRSLLEKCKDGYTQNANESLHSVEWRFCPKVLYLGKEAVNVACA